MKQEQLIDPQLTKAGWGVVEDSNLLRKRNVYKNTDGVKITDGRIQVGGKRAKPLIVDYILVYKGIKLAVVEAKSNELAIGEGVAQAKLYATKLNLETTCSANGKETASVQQNVYCIFAKSKSDNIHGSLPTIFNKQ